MTAIEFEKLFRSAGVEIGSPGFYDDPAFRAAEARNPAMLEVYAAYVDARVLDGAERVRAGRVVADAANFLHERLLRDGREGACVDASMVLSRFLERRGVWNYIVKGGLSVSFPGIPQLSPLYLAPLMANGNRAVAGHVWICAPPFCVVDITTALQPYPTRQKAAVKQHVGVPVLEEAPTKTNELEVPDFVDPDAIAVLTRELERRPTLQDIYNIVPDMFARNKRLGTYLVTRNAVNLKYVGVGVGAPDEPLERIESLRLSGKGAAELWTEFDGAYPGP